MMRARLPSEIVPIVVGTITWRHLVVERRLLAVVSAVVRGVTDIV